MEKLTATEEHIWEACLVGTVGTEQGIVSPVDKGLRGLESEFMSCLNQIQIVMDIQTRRSGSTSSQ
jgi:hypothetical protein